MAGTLAGNLAARVAVTLAVTRPCRADQRETGYWTAAGGRRVAAHGAAERTIGGSAFQPYSTGGAWPKPSLKPRRTGCRKPRCREALPGRPR